MLALSAPVAGQFLEANVSLARFDTRQRRFGDQAEVRVAAAETAPAQPVQARPNVRLVAAEPGSRPRRSSRRGRWCAMRLWRPGPSRPSRRPALLPCRPGRRRCKRPPRPKLVRPSPRRARAARRRDWQARRSARSRPRRAPPPRRRARRPHRRGRRRPRQRAPRPCSTTERCATCAPKPGPSASGRHPQLMATLAAQVDRPVRARRGRAARPRR